MHRLLVLMILCGCASAPVAGNLASREPARHAMMAHLDTLVPTLLDRSGVPGAAVGLVVNGEIVALQGYGTAQIGSGAPITDTTKFNVGSISKLLTAWAVMQLVEAGRVALDSPVTSYLEAWPLPEGSEDPTGVTVRRLLSHTAGLSLGAVPEYGEKAEVPSLPSAFADSAGVELVAPPGSGWSYSGGGYMLLQYLIESVTGRPFARYMRDEVLRPLGMRHSGFGWDETLVTESATPYDDGSAVERFQYAGAAAAGLVSTSTDLGQFVEAILRPQVSTASAGGRLRPATVALMLRPAPGTEQRFGIRTGLGFHLWGLPGSRVAAGHNGQNTGWGAALWTIPETGDGLVVLTNASDGESVWRWILCDWVKWAADAEWRGLCSNRPEWLSAAPKARAAPVPRPAETRPMLDSLLGARFADSAPGASVVATQRGRVLYQGTFGLAELETGRPVRPTTPFYLASVSKPITAAAVARLVADGSLRLDAPIGDYVPGLPRTMRGIPIRRLLTHTSGIPDYYQFLNWQRFRGLGNAAVIDTLLAHPDLEFPPGTRHQYSNSNYVLLAQAISAATGQPYSGALEQLALNPAGASGAFVHDSAVLHHPDRAMGYRESEGGFVPMDYMGLRRGDGSTVPVGFTTTGAGGTYASAPDVARFVDALMGGKLLDSASRDTLVPGRGSPQVEGAPDCPYRFGWYVCERWGDEVMMHDGGFVGFSTAVLHARGHALTVVVLTNRAGGGAKELAVTIAASLLDVPPPLRSTASD